MALNPATRTEERPIPERIARQLRAEIDRGTFPPGVYLPSEKALASNFGVAVNMLRQGLSILAAEGWVTPVNGMGTLVLPRPDPRHVITLNPADPWDALTPKGEPARSRQAADTRTAAQLTIEHLEPLAVITQTALHTDTGVTVRTTRTVPFSAFDGMDRYPDPFGPRERITTALTDTFGPLRTSLRINGLIPGVEDREELGLGLGSMLLQATWITTNANTRGLMIDTVRVSTRDAEFQLRPA
jgi:DNA-binding GntR family transcriptional regulator